MDTRGRVGIVSGNITSAVVLLLLLLPLFSVCQISQPHRYEREHKGSDDVPTIISMSREGIAMVYSKEKYSDGKKLWAIVMLDTALTERKTVEVNIETRYHLVGYDYIPGYFYLLYSAGESSRNALVLYEFNTAGDELGRYEIKPELDFKLTHFIKAGEKMALGGYVNKEPVVLLFEMKSSLIKVLPGFFQKDMELVDIRTNQNKSFNVVLIDRSLKLEKKLVFRTFDDNGELLLEDIVPMDDNRSLQTVISSTLEHEELVVMGTWGHKQDRQSTGFFVLHIDPFHDQKIHYFYLTRLSHYLDRFKPARAKHLKDKGEDDILADRDPDFSEYIMPFKVEETKDGFLMLAEVYTPVNNLGQYNTPYGYGPSMYGSPYYYNPYWPNYYAPGRMYNPYALGSSNKAYTEINAIQTVLISVDHKGNMLWDQAVKMEEISNRTSLEQVSDFYQGSNRVTMLYRMKEGKLRVRTTDIADDESKEVTEEIKLLEPQDEFRDEKDDIGGVVKWYDNSFFVWGYQTVRNVTKEDRVRDVFYINKVVAPK